MCTEAGYSCIATKGSCKDSTCTVDRPGKCHGYKDVSSESKQTLMTTVAQQRVSSAIEADQSLRQTCTSGVLITSCGTKLDRSILAAVAPTTGRGDTLSTTPFCDTR